MRAPLFPFPPSTENEARRWFLAAATIEDVLDRVYGGALVGLLEDGL
jgi:hypothetical protein